MIHKQQLMLSTGLITIWTDDEKQQNVIVDENAENSWMTRLNEHRLNKTHILQKQLEIAIDTLKIYGKMKNWRAGNMFDLTYYGYTKAQEALKKIEELEND